MSKNLYKGKLKVDPKLARKRISCKRNPVLLKTQLQKCCRNSREIQERKCSRACSVLPNSIQDNGVKSKKAIPFRLPLSLAARLLIIVGSWVVYQSFYGKKLFS